MTPSQIEVLFPFSSEYFIEKSQQGIESLIDKESAYPLKILWI